MLKQLISKRSLLLVVSLIITMQSVTAYAANDLAVIRSMTEKYHQLQVALDEGFQPVFDCISHHSEGAMGYHYGLFSRFDDQLVLEEPEVLVYAPDKEGKQKLAAVEYIIPAAAWNKAEAPTFLGKTLKLKNTVGPYPADPYWELHVWVWRHNATDMYADWNPAVSCEHEHATSANINATVKSALVISSPTRPIGPITWPKPPTL